MRPCEVHQPNPVHAAGLALGPSLEGSGSTTRVCTWRPEDDHGAVAYVRLLRCSLRWSSFSQMKSTNYDLALGTVVLLGVFVSGCASGPATLGPTDDASIREPAGMSGGTFSPAIEELNRSVLVIQKSPSGHVTSSSSPAPREHTGASCLRLPPGAAIVMKRTVSASVSV